MATHTVNRVSSTITRMFSSLTIRNYRLSVVGQGISLSGTWMQTVAQGLLVLQLTGSGTALGLVTALQTIPVLLFGPWGGVVADRFPKRRILYVTQAVSSVLALLLGTLVATGTIRIEMVYLVALCLGAVSAIDNPTRQSFVMEMVGKDELVNAVSLNSTEINLARVIGPAIAGILIASVGLAACFLINGLSFRQGPATYAAMTAAMGLGAVVGGLYTASQGIGSLRRLTIAALLFGASVLLTAVAPTLPLALLALVAVGFCSIGFTSLGNATLQLTSSAEMRGRVMALWTVAFLGSTPIGGPVIGAIGEHVGPRWALALGGVAAVLAAGLGAGVFAGNSRTPVTVGTAAGKQNPPPG